MSKELLELKDISITLPEAELQGNGIVEIKCDNKFDLFLDELSL